MQTFMFIAALAFAKAMPLEQGVQLVQDTFGNYKLAFATDEETRHEERFEDGNVVGSYSFKDTDNKTHVVHYVSGKNGFQSAGVVETPEVANARAVHLATVAKQRSLLPVLTEESIVVPSRKTQQVARSYDEDKTTRTLEFVPTQFVALPEDTDEVKAAKMELQAAHNSAIAALAKEYIALARRV